jgi:hypothetical protein
MIPRRLALVIFVFACNRPEPAADDGGEEGDTWWDPPPGTSAMAGDEESVGDEEDGGSDESGEDREEFVGWWLEGDVVPGESISAFGEVIAYVDGTEQCLLAWEPADVTVDDGCPDCAFAFRVRVQALAVEIDTRCAELGIDAATLEGTVLGVGLDADAAWTLRDATWVRDEGGYAEYDPETPVGAFAWGIPLP